MKKNDAIWFIVGTGTDVGKTVVAAALLRSIADAGMSVQAVKAVQTGCVAEKEGTLSAPDVAVYREACPGGRAGALVCFRDPCSPHLAAEREGGRLSAKKLASRVKLAATETDYTIVEGAGGLLVPLNESETMADFAALLGARIIVVASNMLGSINHTLLTLDALTHRGMEADAVVFVNTTRGGDDSLEQAIRLDNVATVSRMIPEACVVGLPYYEALIDPEDSGKRMEMWTDAAGRLRSVVRTFAKGVDSGEKGLSQSIVDFDTQHLWHPYAKTTPPPEVWTAKRTEGTRIILDDGRELVDGMSSWWAAVHGYNHPRLMRALREQLGKMPHVMFGGLTHEPAVALGEALLSLLPEGLSRIFYCDSGSVAVEAALKMSIQYQNALGRRGKRRIASAFGGYHGDTTGAMGVCDPVNGMHRNFEGLLPRQLFFDRPACPFDSDFDSGTLASVNQLFREHGDELAAVIIEPVVQGAGGMWFYHPEYLRWLRRLCDEYGVLLIADEIATGFGRTGRMFACEWAGIVPDIMCVGKALAGGVMTLAAVVAREDIAAAISADGVFMHGPTFMANPLACATATASLELLRSSPWRSRVEAIETRMRQGLEQCVDAEGIADVRVLGAIGVVETTTPVNVQALQRFFVDTWGVWIRPFANLIYIMPPFVTEDADIERLCRAHSTRLFFQSRDSGS